MPFWRWPSRGPAHWVSSTWGMITTTHELRWRRCAGGGPAASEFGCHPGARSPPLTYRSRSM
jgi:hypothetical protein